MPNIVAYVALICWPVITILLFQTLPVKRAVVWSLLAGYLLLPVRTQIDFSGIPALDKTSIPILSLVLCLALFAKRGALSMPQATVLRITIFTFIAIPVFTSFGNSDPILFAMGGIKGMNLYDGLSASALQAITVAPLIIGYNLMGDATGRREIVRALALAGMIYTIPMILEIRLSPQLHNWAYGFFPSNFGQQMRDGGFRPVVFLGHGLLVAIFCCISLLAVVSLWRQKKKVIGIPASWASIYIGVVLLLCKSLGAIALAVIFAPILRWARPKTLIAIAAALSLAVLIYPAMRGAGLIPVERIERLAERISPNRAASLQFRLDNEEILLAKANERPIFGWGTWGRNRIYSAETGAKASVTDGAWIILIGQYGWVGYLAYFGMLVVPIVLAFTRSKNVSTDVWDLALISILLVNLLDSIPNASINSITWLISGSIWARYWGGGTVVVRKRVQDAEISSVNVV